MSRKKVGVFCLFLFFTFFIIVPKVEATEEMKTKFTVTPVLPENQVSGTSSYYDLILAPKQSSTIVLDIKDKFVFYSCSFTLLIYSISALILFS